MINRTLIRIRVLQLLYSLERAGKYSADLAQSQVLHALEQSYRLYLLMAVVPYHIREAAVKRLEQERSRRVQREQQIAFLERLLSSKYLAIVCEDRAWIEETERLCPRQEKYKVYFAEVVAKMLGEDSEDFISKECQSFEEDKAFWRELYKRYFRDHEGFHALLQDCCLYWNDDINIVMSFVLKLSNSVKAGVSYKSLLKPAYRSEEEKDFASRLAYDCMAKREEYTTLISAYFRNWDKERVPEMDFLIMRMAVTEVLAFPDIATQVSINEALELARYYSSEENINYINGILHSLIEDLKSSGRRVGA